MMIFALQNDESIFITCLYSKEIDEILKKSFDYSIETKGNPTLNNGKYDIPLKITIKLNKNFYEFRKYFINSFNGLSMSESEIVNYED